MLNVSAYAAKNRTVQRVNLGKHPAAQQTRHKHHRATRLVLHLDQGRLLCRGLQWGPQDAEEAAHGGVDEPVITISLIDEVGDAGTFGGFESLVQHLAAELAVMVRADSLGALMVALKLSSPDPRIDKSSLNIKPL